MIFISPIDFIILAGGQGTRLKSVSDKQKVGLTVNGKPFLYSLIKYFAGQGGRRYVIGTGYHADWLLGQLAQYPLPNVDLVSSYEESPLGTGGCIRKALSKTTSDPVIVANGDSFLEVSLESMLVQHKEKKAGITIALKYINDVSRYGKVKIDSNKKIEEFHEKDVYEVNPGYINGGIYIINREVIESMPEGSFFSFEKEILPKYTCRDLYGFITNGAFIDIGTPSSYRLAQDFFKNLTQ